MNLYGRLTGHLSRAQQTTRTRRMMGAWGEGEGGGHDTCRRGRPVDSPGTAGQEPETAGAGKGRGDEVFDGMQEVNGTKENMSLVVRGKAFGLMPHHPGAGRPPSVPNHSATKVGGWSDQHGKRDRELRGGNDSTPLYRPPHTKI